MSHFVEMSESEQIDLVARTIYERSAEDVEETTGHPRRLWQTNAPWDTNKDELTEWERDEYRAQARAVLRLFEAEQVPTAFMQKHPTMFTMAARVVSTAVLFWWLASRTYLQSGLSAMLMGAVIVISYEHVIIFIDHLIAKIRGAKA